MEVMLCSCIVFFFLLFVFMNSASKLLHTCLVKQFSYLQILCIDPQHYSIPQFHVLPVIVLFGFVVLDVIILISK